VSALLSDAAFGGIKFAKADEPRAFPQLRVSIRAYGPRTFGLIRRQMAHGGMYPFFEPEEAK
jgi:hypothetical protein